MSAAYRRAPGVRVAALDDDSFAAFSALSGETHIVNAESVALLDCLDEHTAADEHTLAERLAVQHDLVAEAVQHALRLAWPSLLRAGLVCRAGGHDRD